MNANPHSCPHLSLTYDKVAGGSPFIRCMDCDTTWDADEPITDGDWNDTRVSFDHGDENDTWENHPEWEEHHTRVCLNPDNEPTSEHMQWSEDNDDQA